MPEPTPASAHDVADELRKRLGPDLGVAKLHKLLYYAQGWHLAWAREPMFREQIRAGANGPIVALLWADETHRCRRPHPSRWVGMPWPRSITWSPATGG